MLFSNLPAGDYSVKAYGKTLGGAVAAKCESSVTIVVGETTTTTLHLSRINHWTVTFIDDGSVIPAQEVSDGYTATKPANPTRSGYSFLGWYTSSDGGATLSGAYNFDTEITGDITLYAKWGVTLSGLSDYLASLPKGSVSSPNVLPVITGLDSSNWNQIIEPMQINNTKYVDLSATSLPAGITDMYAAFCGTLYVNNHNKLNIVKAPVIPAGVTTMRFCFCDCQSLATAPVIPASVTSMEQCFAECNSLTTAPVIPAGVANMAGCFARCASLTTAPVIPAGVTDMRYCFLGCTSLTGNVVIKASITDSDKWSRTFEVVTGVTVWVPDAGTKAAVLAGNSNLTDANVQVGEP